MEIAMEEPIATSQPTTTASEPLPSVSNVVPTESEEGDNADLDLYASDNESEMPLEVMSTIQILAEYRPVTFEEAAERDQEEPSRHGQGHAVLAAVEKSVPSDQ